MIIAAAFVTELTTVGPRALGSDVAKQNVLEIYRHYELGSDSAVQPVYIKYPLASGASAFSEV